MAARIMRGVGCGIVTMLLETRDLGAIIDGCNSGVRCARDLEGTLCNLGGVFFSAEWIFDLDS